MHHDYTKVTILCRCGYRWDLCGLVGLAVPEPVQCRPGAPIDRPRNSRSDIACPECRGALFSSDSDLRICVESELRARRGRHARCGTVVVDRR